MTTKEKVCRNCKRFVNSSKCPVCNQSNFSRSWKGVIYVNDPNSSEVAKLLGINAPGKYCLWTR
ncbi:MAG: transcription elongation factor subunit Spt4 [Candidatus Aenigmatarchaeota archaeon]